MSDERKLTAAGFDALRGHTRGRLTVCNVGDYGDYDGRCVVVLGENDTRRIAVFIGDDKAASANAKLFARANALLNELIERRARESELLATLKLIAETRGADAARVMRSYALAALRGGAK